MSVAQLHERVMQQGFAEQLLPLMPPAPSAAAHCRAPDEPRERRLSTSDDMMGLD
jgi:hypothetical protein